MRFAILLVSTLAATAMLTSAPAQQLPQRIHSQTGVREVVATDPVLFSFPVKVQFLPPVFGLKPLVVASDQEHRLAAINTALSADITQPPWIVTKVFVFGQQ